MQRDLRIILIILICALAGLIWLQNTYCISPNNTSSENSIQHFTVDSTSDNKFKKVDSSNISNNQISNLQLSGQLNGLKSQNPDDKSRSSKESQKVTSRIVDNILRNESKLKSYQDSGNTDLESLMTSNAESMQNSRNSRNPMSPMNEMNEMGYNSLVNPMDDDLNSERNNIEDSDQQVLDELIKEVNTGNDLIVDNPRSELYKSKSKSINSAKKYRKVSYKDSGYRYDFDEDGSPSQTSQDELNSMYDDALIFRNNEYNTNGDFKGFNETEQNYGGANLNDFKPSGPQTQQEKVLALYNSNEYLPNNNLLDKKLTKGFQILDNPVAVDNPNLIPVLKSIPVSSVMGSNRNQTYDIRAEPPCPKTVVSPFNNSSIMPDIYSTQRGCL